ncbi:MAG TPA: hypothetical protein VE219_02495, partial [Candidatus Sulfotelmatobacter sp.]|nr:hypothetical protein [Candidatus Sulfotelmatobacter sp.]
MDEGIPLTRTVRGNAARATARRALHLASLLLAPAPFVLAVLAIALSHDVDILILAALVVVWNASGALLALRYPAEHLGQVVLWASFVAGAGTAGIALLSHGTAAAQFAHLMRPLSLALLPAAALHLFLALPDGVVEGRAWRVTVAAGYLVGAAIGAVYAAQAEDVPLALVALEVVPAAVAAWIGSNQRYWRVTGRERQRMQWFGWAMTVALGIGLIAIAARILVGWPAHEGQIIAAATFPVPLALSLGTSSRLVHRIDRLLTGTISLVGLCGVVVAVYLAIVLGLGRVPNEQEGGLLFLSMVAAGVSALLYHPARRWLVSFAERRVYGEQREPRTVLSTFGSRLSRAIPLDELLLQLVEALHRSLSLSCAEVWIGAEGS